jgi:hypothetical protein
MKLDRYIDTDPVMQKVAIYGADFLRTFWMFFSIF